jgi:hypothetical protein
MCPVCDTQAAHVVEPFGRLADGAALTLAFFSRKGEMFGRLEVYDPASRLCFFETSSPDLKPAHHRCLILIGGMTDGPLSLPYTAALSDFCLGTLRIRCVMPFLHTSYLNFGLHTLDRDVEDIAHLLRFLSKEHALKDAQSTMEFVLMGHSTGCQIVMSTARTLVSASQAEAFHVTAIILQGAVSDRQYMQATMPTDLFEQYLSLSGQMVRTGRDMEVMPRSSYFVPIIAARYFSLASVG